MKTQVKVVISILLACIILIPSLVSADTIIPTIKTPINIKPLKLNLSAIPKVYNFVPPLQKDPLKLDGTQSSWAETELQDAYAFGLTYEQVENGFQNQITREEFSTIAVKLYEKLSGKSTTIVANPFTDTNNKEILKAYGIGIVKGTSATTFSPNSKITRQEICVMIQRALKASYPNLDTNFSGEFPFKDIKNIASWAIDSMKYSYKYAIMKGTSNDTISPLNNTTREQAIILLKRTYLKGTNNELSKIISADDISAFENNKIFPSYNVGAIGKSIIVPTISNPFELRLVKLPEFGTISPSIAPGYPLKNTDSELRGVQWLGKGFNIITDKYADANSLKEYYILDTNKLLNEGRIYKIDTNKSESKFIEGQSATSYSSSLAKSIGIDGSYMFFSGSVSTNFSSTSITENNRKYATLLYEASRYGVYIDDQTINLKNYLSNSFKNALATMEPVKLFELYGTHVLRSIRLGGRIEYNATSNSVYNSQTNSLEVDAKASFNALFASGGAEVKTSQSTTSSSFIENSERNIKAYPVYGSADLDPAKFNDWFNYMLKEPGMSDFGLNPLIPIWELTSDSNRKSDLYEAYKNYAESKNFVPSQVTHGINGIRVQRYALGDASRKDEYIDPITGEVWKAISNIKAHTGRPGEELAFIYVREGYSNDINKPPVVGIFMVNETQGEDPIEIFNQLYGDDPTARLWGYAGEMEKNSGLDYYIHYEYGDKLTLHYVTSMKKPQIMALRVRHISTDWNTYYSPASLASDTSFFPVIDIGSYNQGKPDPQDSTEGTPESIKVRIGGFDFYLKTYRFTFIEYSYE